MNLKDGFRHLIRRYTRRVRSLGPVAGNPDTVRQMTIHIERHLGPASSVFHEATSEAVHVDVYHVAPASDRSFHTLVTSGMSDLPMPIQPGDEKARWAELVMTLAPEWRLDRDSWPVDLLRLLARSPHLDQAAFWIGDTIPNGDPACPYAAGTDFSCSLLFYPLNVPPGFWNLEIDAKQVWMLAVVPIYPEEMLFKLQNGAEALMAQLAKQGGDPNVVRLGRPNGCTASGV